MIAPTELFTLPETVPPHRCAVCRHPYQPTAARLRHCSEYCERVGLAAVMLEMRARRVRWDVDSRDADGEYWTETKAMIEAGCERFWRLRGQTQPTVSDAPMWGDVSDG